MGTDTPTPRPGKAALIVGWILTLLVGLMLLMSAVTKFTPPTEETRKGLEGIGWREDQTFALGILELACVLFYLFPRTAVLGAVLITGYMGGAIATHVRVDENLIIAVHIVIGVVIWLGLFLREPRLRALIPFRTG
jgi:hypothetical protein